MSALRLYTEEVSHDSPADASIEMTLREAFQQYFVGSMKGKALSTAAEYWKALDHWEELTSDPPIGQIDDATCEDFRNRAADAGFSHATVNKWGRHLTAVFNRLSPKGPRNRKGKSILRDCPLFEPLPRVDLDPVCLSDSQINAIYRACDVAEWPSPRIAQCSAPDLWRAATVMLITYGPRRNDLFSIRWSHVNFENNTIGFRAGKTKKWHHFPMTPVIRAHLLAIQSDRDIVLPITSSHHCLYGTWQRIQKAAGVTRRGGEFYGFHHLRQTCAARCEEHIPGTASIILGHSLSSVTHDHYLGQNAVRAAARCILTIRQPSAFEAKLEIVEDDFPAYNTGSD